jgi:uncharacterized protein YbaA (DUF1428 family)
MIYVAGFVTPIASAAKERFTEHAKGAAQLFRSYGGTRVVDAWGVDVPDGKVNDFKGAVRLEDGEAVGFGWIEYPDKATYQSAGEKMMSDPAMRALGDMPFDGRRMIFGGFETIVEHGTPTGSGYVEGFVLPVPTANREAYRKVAEIGAPVFMDHGITRYVEAWGDHVPAGSVTDFARAAHAEAGETVVFAWCEWPDRATRDAGMKAIMADERMEAVPDPMPFDGKRMIIGGFEIVSDA